MPVVRKDPEDSKFLDLNFINLNDKKIDNKLPHMSCFLIQMFRPSGFFSLFTKSKPGENFKVKIRLHNTLKKQDTHNW